jgi:hypothetical protein
MIVFGGIYNLAFAAFHLAFWKLFRWKEDLVTLSVINRGAMQILNLSLTFAFLMFAYVSIFHTSELLTTGIGRSLLLLIALFWLFRAIEQLIFFGLTKKVSVAFFVVFLIGVIVYLYPLIATN